MKTIRIILNVALLSLICGCATHSKMSSTCNGAKTHDWEAWNNLMPGIGSTKTIHVTGKAKVNSGGWSAVLSKRVPQGINPAILMLDLQVTPPAPGGVVILPVLDLPLEYSEQFSGDKFTRVQVFCGEKEVANLPVKDAH